MNPFFANYLRQIPQTGNLLMGGEGRGRTPGQNWLISQMGGPGPGSGGGSAAASGNGTVDLTGFTGGPGPGQGGPVGGRGQESGVAPAGVSGNLGLGLIGQLGLSALGAALGIPGLAAIGNTVASVAEANTQLGQIGAQPLGFGQALSALANEATNPFGIFGPQGIIGTSAADAANANALGTDAALGIGVTSGSTPTGESPSAQANAIAAQMGAEATGSQAGGGVVGSAGESVGGAVAGAIGTGGEATGGQAGGGADAAGSAGSAAGGAVGAGIGGYAQGGPVQRTGSAQVHGSVQHPEFVLPRHAVEMLGMENLRRIQQIANSAAPDHMKHTAIHQVLRKIASAGTQFHGTAVNHNPFARASARG